VASLHFQYQVGATAHDPGATGVLIQQFKRFFNGMGEVIMFPERHDSKYLDLLGLTSLQ
jgi:hypothetical protein